MTGRELLDELQKLDAKELNYTILIGAPELGYGWCKLVSFSKDQEMKSLDLRGDEK